jgi:hypothetical protein
MPLHCRKVDAAITIPVARRDGSNLDGPAACRRQRLMTLLKDTHERGANGTQARNADFKGI